jgi:excisionase family DNA binding protein
MNALLTIEDVAAWLNVPKQRLYAWRHSGGKGPPAIVLEGRLLRWRPEDVERWLDSGRDDGRRHAGPHV